MQKQSEENKTRPLKWDREEVVILVTEYFRTKGMSSGDIAAAQSRVSAFLRKRHKIITGEDVDDIFRNAAGIYMQSNRIRCLDLETKYSGMQGTRLQKEVVQEYLQNPGKVKSEAAAIVEKYGGM